MAEQKTTQHSLKKDKYVNARGGNSHFLDLFCSKCNQHLALYQKDGRGRLLRMYLDRIFEPQELSFLHSRIGNKAGMPNLKCSKCGALIGTPMIYEAERRLAFRLIHGSFVKKKSDGVYPPTQQTQNTEKGGSDEKRN
jgi:ribosomal protein S27E